MATLFHFPPCFSLFPHKLFYSRLPSLNIHCRPCSHLPTIYASSSKKSRIRRKVRSNEDICNDIREFVSEFQFPEGHLPSFKELSLHGRQDLANIVRRRGYKLLKELLATSVKTNIDVGNIENELTEKQDKATPVNMNQQGQVKDLAEVGNLSSEASIIEDDSNNIYIGSEFNLDDNNCISTESSTESSLQEKVTKFIQKGELNMIEDNESVAVEGKGFFESENPTELESSSIIEEQSDQIFSQTDLSKILSGSDVLSFQQVMPSSAENGMSRNDYFSTGGLSTADCNNDLDVETRKKENEVEISRLKFMLHQKELELSELKQQIEKEKLALSVLQTEAETEMSNAQKLISDKDAELHAAEESLSGLEEVQLQYRDDGESVEVAGSFNGWHQRIKMDPEPASRIMDPISRKSRLWRTVLWLYPGIYEIKFIVDGHWKIDPERESVTKGTIHNNNILRVSR